MNEKYLKLIEALAEKLNVTAEHLWDILIKQAPISGAIGIVTCTIMVVVALWWFRFVVHKTKCPSETAGGGYPTAEWPAEAAALSWASVVVFTVITLGYVIGSVADIVSAFTNPEYWALMQLIR